MKRLSLKNGVILSIVIFLLSWGLSVLTTNQNGKTPIIVAIPLLLSVLLFIFCVISLIVKFLRKKASPHINKVKNDLSPYIDSASKNIKNTKDKSTSFIQQISHDRNEKNKQKILAKQEREKLAIQEKNEKVTVKKETEHKKNDSSFNGYKMVNGEATIWQGETNPATINTFEHKLKGIITRVFIREDGEFYIDIADEVTGEVFTAKEKEIRTKIRVGSTYYDFVELCRRVLKLNCPEMFSFASDVRAEAKKPVLIKTFAPVDVTFAYDSRQNGKSRRTVTVTKFYQNKEGSDYIEGYCHHRKEERLFKASNMLSELKVGNDEYYFNEFVDKFINGQQ